MQLCGVSIEVVKDTLCVEANALRMFGLYPSVSGEESDVGKHWEDFQKHLRSVGYMSSMFLDGENGEQKYIHIQAFFLLIITKATLDTCNKQMKSALETFFNNLFTKFMQMLHTEQCSLSESVTDYGMVNTDFADPHFGHAKSSDIAAGVNNEEGNNTGIKMKKEKVDPKNLMIPLETIIKNLTSTPNSSGRRSKRKSKPTQFFRNAQEPARIRYSSPISEDITDDNDEDYEAEIGVGPRRENKPKKQKPAGKKRGRKPLASQYTCDECGKSFKRPQHLKRHMYVHSADRSCECIECGKTFKNPYDLKNHESVHAKVRPYTCEDCGKGFVRKSHLQRHKQLHYGTADCKCDICGKVMKTPYGLRKHKTTHSEAKPYPCSICGRPFAQKHDVRKHKITHYGEHEKPLQCSECGIFVKSPVHLRYHKLTKHTTERNHPCPVCSKTFFTKSALKRHSQTHKTKEEREHVCSYCNKRFSEKKNLNTHLRIHTGYKPYCCSICNKTFIQKASLNYHMSSHHGSGEKVPRPRKTTTRRSPSMVPRPPLIDYNMTSNPLPREEHHLPTPNPTLSAHLHQPALPASSHGFNASRVPPEPQFPQRIQPNTANLMGRTNSPETMMPSRSLPHSSVLHTTSNPESQYNQRNLYSNPMLRHSAASDEAHRAAQFLTQGSTHSSYPMVRPTHPDEQTQYMAAGAPPHGYPMVWPTPGYPMWHHNN